jgi:hypothetical protein
MIKRYRSWFDSLLPHTKAFVWVSGIAGVMAVVDIIGMWIFKLS